MTFWFKQMMCYHVYVPLLLRLSNDVEENPGPTIHEVVSSNNTVCAEFSQGNRVKFGDNAEKQCVAMSLTAIIFRYVEATCNWSKSDLNNISFHCNSLYKFIKGSVQKDFLLLTDVPDMLAVNERIYYLTDSEPLTEELSLSCDSGPYVCLKNAFADLFSGGETSCECCLLTINCNTIAVFIMYNNNFKIFDSRSRDLYRMPSSFG